MTQTQERDTMDAPIEGAAAELHRRLETVDRTIEAAINEKKSFNKEWNDDMKTLTGQKNAILLELGKLEDGDSEILPMFTPPDMDDTDEDEDDLTEPVDAAS